MSTSTIAVTASTVPTAHPAGRFRRAKLSALLLIGCVLASAAAQWLAPSLDMTAAVPATDPALLRLMQGMALIKLALVAAAGGLLVWRFGRPISPAVTAGYLACIWTLCAATVLIWQSSWLGLASLLFHGAGLAFVVLGLRDDRALPASLQRRAGGR